MTAGAPRDPIAAGAEAGTSDAAALYARALVDQAVPVLGDLDRETFSRTFGCFDRTFWSWKFVDFPGARFQEGLCFLAYLHATALPGSDYTGNETLARWIEGGVGFWCDIQRAEGDFDEAYPLERSLAATAFTTFYLCEARGLLGDAMSASMAARFNAAVTRSGDWLIRNDETHGFLSNHLAAAAGALVHAHRLTGEARFEARARTFLDRILEHQSDEGWFDEYGGADPGYQTHGSFYLERCAELLEDGALTDALDRSYRFLADWVHPDRSLGGEYTSRNTQTYYPAAFEIAAPRSGAAAWIAAEMRSAVETASAAGLRSVDPYNRFPLLNNCVFAHRAVAAGASPAAPEPPDPGAGVIHLEGAGLLKVRREHYDAFIGVHKGGVIKVFDRRARRLALSDCGYVGRLGGGGVLSNQWTEPGRPATLSADRLEVSGGFYQVSRPVMDPYRFIGFRIFSLVLGRIPRIATWLKALLVRVLIYRKRDLPLHFERRIGFEDEAVTIEDEIRATGSVEIETLRQEDAFTTIHMGSSRYFIPHELLPSAAPLDPTERDVDLVALATGVTRSRSVRFG